MLRLGTSTGESGDGDPEGHDDSEGHLQVEDFGQHPGKNRPQEERAVPDSRHRRARSTCPFG